MYRRRNSDDELCINDIKSEYPTKNLITMEFHSISYSISWKKKTDRKFLLNNVSGEIKSGQLTAIIGPSGAGKTTLMNILSGHKSFGTYGRTSITGSVLINGKYRNSLKFRRICSYVLQNCMFFVHFSVIETVTFAANCKLSEKLSSECKQQKINDVLEALNLTGSRDTKVQNLSGGERKRLSIAIELVSNPPVLFLDEPTSGLDSSSCNAYISLLKSLANQSRIIVCSMHHPSSKVFEAFDELFVMAKGQCAYRGPTKDVVSFMSSLNFYCPEYYNPADFLLEKVTEKGGSSISILVAKTNKNEKETKNSENRNFNTNYTFKVENENGFSAALKNFFARDYYPTSILTQFRILFSREMKSAFRNKRVVATQFLSHLLTGLILGILTYGIGNTADKFVNNISALFGGNLVILLLSKLPVIILFPLERKIISREHLNGWHSIFPFFIAKSLSLSILQVIHVVTFTSIFYWMSSQPNELFRFSMYIIFEILLVLASQATGLCVGAAANVEVSVFVGGIIAVAVLLFCGFFIRLNSIPYYLKWMYYLSYMSYGYEGIMISIYGFNRTELECDGHCLLSSPPAILEELNLNESHFQLDFLGIYAFYLAGSLIAYAILRWKVK